MAEVFVVKPPSTFWRAVPIYSPDGGEQSIDIEWVWMEKSALDAWAERMRIDPSLATLAKAVAGWRGVMDEHSKIVPFSVDALQWLCGKYPSAALHLFLGYVDAMTDGRRKN